MKKELQDILVGKHPSMFRDIGGDQRVTCMAWGLECGDGWFSIIDCLCSVIQRTAENLKHRWSDKCPDLVFDVKAEQVKEKFGSLRFYISIESNEKDLALSPEDAPMLAADIKRGIESIYGAISMAESMSARTCESCGAAGTIDGNYWLRCRCEECKDSTREDEKVDAAVLRMRVKELENMIADVSFTLADWDGYYDEENFTGNANQLACLIDDAYGIMQNGKSCSMQHKKSLRDRLRERDGGEKVVDVGGQMLLPFDPNEGGGA